MIEWSCTDDHFSTPKAFEHCDDNEFDIFLDQIAQSLDEDIQCMKHMNTAYVLSQLEEKGPIDVVEDKEDEDYSSLDLPGMGKLLEEADATIDMLGELITFRGVP